MKDRSKNHFLAEATLLLIICQNVRKLCINFCSNIELNSRPWRFCRFLQASFYVDSVSCTGFFFFQSEFSSTMLDQPTAALPRRTYNSVFTATMTPRDYRGLFSSHLLTAASLVKGTCTRGVELEKTHQDQRRSAAIVVLPQSLPPPLLLDQPPLHHHPSLPPLLLPNVVVPPLLPRPLPSVERKLHLLQPTRMTTALRFFQLQCLEPMQRNYQPSLPPQLASQVRQL